MKKIIAFTFIFVLSFCSVYADNELWEVVDKSTIDNTIDYSKKVGDYFFDFVTEHIEEEYDDVHMLCYSTDGINFVKTDYYNKDGEKLPIYKDGKYFLFDTTMISVPENKRTYGFNNSPSYILDENLNLLSKIEHNGFATYDGYNNGYHYISWGDYNSIVYDNGWKGERVDFIYKTLDGINLEPVDINNEDLSFLHGVQLYDNNVWKNEYQGGDALVIEGNQYYILREKNNFVGASWISTVFPLMELTYKIGEKEYIDAISVDCVYGIKMPEDIGSYCFEKDGKFYFEKDESSYYCIKRSDLVEKPKIVYNDKILSFETPPLMEEDRILVPMRFLLEQMGAEVSWEERTETATVEKEDDVISFSIDNKNANVNNSVKTMDVPARLIDDKTMVPLRFLSEELGFNVEWDGETNTAIISE